MMMKHIFFDDINPPNHSETAHASLSVSVVTLNQGRWQCAQPKGD